MTNDSEWLETSDNQIVLCLVNMAGEVKLPKSCSVYIFVRFLLHVDKHCHGEKLVSRDIWRTLTVFLSMLGSVSSIVVYREQL